MERTGNKFITIWFLFIMIGCNGGHVKDEPEPARDVLARIIGSQPVSKFELKLDTVSSENYTIEVINNKVHISGSDQVALCRGVYDYQ